MISALLLAGGTGSRMGSALPKQFLSLAGQAVALYSYATLSAHPAIEEIVVVCPPAFQPLFSPPRSLSLRFALPGVRRQDSLAHGLDQLSPHCQWVCIHDAARPFIPAQKLDSLFVTGKEIGAATLGVPAKATVKLASATGSVVRTLPRAHIWEIQTPQFLKRSLLEQGIAYTQAHGLEVTDDTSLAELLGHPVHIVPGEYTNFKLTTPEDWDIACCFAERFLAKTPS